MIATEYLPEWRQAGHFKMARQLIGRLAQRRPAVRQAKMSAADKSILIVDDNGPVRSAIRTMLERSGECIICGEATDGLEAVQLVREKHPHLVVMDLAMPGMNGLEAACEIKRIQPDALIVVFSLYSDAFRKFTDEALGIDLVVSKADGAAGLLRALHPFLARS